MAEYCPTCQQAIKRPHVGGGRVPYGFTRVDGQLAFDETTGPYMAAMIQHHTNGARLRDIADWLARHEVEGGPWYYHRVHRIIKRGRELSHLIPVKYCI